MVMFTHPSSISVHITIIIISILFLLFIYSFSPDCVSNHLKRSWTNGSTIIITVAQNCTRIILQKKTRNRLIQPLLLKALITIRSFWMYERISFGPQNSLEELFWFSSRFQSDQSYRSDGFNSNVRLLPFR